MFRKRFTMRGAGLLATAILFSGLISVILAADGGAVSDEALAQADQNYAEKSFRLASDVYGRFLESPKAKEHPRYREIQFKHADALWREGDPQNNEKAAGLLEDLARQPPNDRWWAEAAQSRAELFLQWNRWERQRDIEEHLRQAEQFWAHSTDLAAAIPKYVELNFSLAELARDISGWGPYAGVFRLTEEPPYVAPRPEPLPRQEEISYTDDLVRKSLLNVLDRAGNDADKARAISELFQRETQLANFMRSNRKPEDAEMLEKTAVGRLDSILKDYVKTEYYDDALIQLGDYYNERNNFLTALDYYRRVTSEFRRAQTPFYDQAVNQIDNIVSPALNINGNQAFPPDSYIALDLNYRNLDSVHFALWRLPALKAADIQMQGDFRQAILRMELPGQGERIREWDEEGIVNEGEHIPRNKSAYLDPLLPGMYVVEASTTPAVKGGLENRRAVFLVTDLAATLMIGKDKLFLFAASTSTGEPAPNANIRIVHFWQERAIGTAVRGGRDRDWMEKQETLSATTGANGLAEAANPAANADENVRNNHRFMAVVEKDGMPAIVGDMWFQPYGRPQWNPIFYAYADRPAYRPNETIHFKALIRKYNGWEYQMPDQSSYWVRIVDHQGSPVFEKELTPDEYGAVYGDAELGDKPALGMYTITFGDPASKNQIGGATLCRVEEYKLPEFTVNVTTAKSAYKLGDVIDGELNASYYFGGPVPNAEVTMVIKQRPYQHWFWWPCPYPWFYDQGRGGRWGYWGRGQETIVKEETIHTNEEGKASFSFATPAESDSDYAYTIEARVVDQSRREVQSTQEIKVTRQEYFAYLKPEHWIYRPGDRVEIEIKTMDANDKPVARQAEMQFYRLVWTGEPFELEGKQVDRGYKPEYLYSRPIATNEGGEGRFEFEPDEPAYYEARWAGQDSYGQTVKSQCRFWVCPEGVYDIGYRYGGIQIISDRETYQTGDTAKLMIASFLPHSWALVSVEAEDVYSIQVVELDGPVQLIELPIGKEHEPNVFIHASQYYGLQLFMDQKELIVPPVENYIETKVTMNKEQYLPGEKATATIETLNEKGEPVSAQVSLGVADSAVYYIQQEVAQDIRQFFYGNKRGDSIQTQTSHSTFYFQYFKKNDSGEIESVSPRDRFAGLKDAQGDGQAGMGGDRMDVDEFASGGFTVAGGRSMEMRAAKSVMAEGAVAMDMAMPMSAPMPMVAGEERMYYSEGALGALPEEAPLAEAVVRTDFRATAYWQPAVVTDAAGKATMEFAFPDSLTEWRATTRAVDKETRVGWSTTSARTKKNILVRLQAPRFFVEGDEVVISANIHNYTGEDRVAVVTIDAAGLDLLQPAEAAVEAKSVSTEPAFAGAAKIELGVKQDSERRVDWRFKAPKAGEAKIKATAQTSVDADAMEKTYPIYEHGMEKFVAQNAKLGGGAEAAGAESSVVLAMDLPEQRKPEADALTIQLTPSLAATMVGSLDYLAKYPYGCVEQTLSRFVPTVITARTLHELGIARPELDAQIPDMVKAGLDRLRDFQHDDGGWAWWKEGPSDPFMTAYVLYGLTLAREAGQTIPQEMLDGAIRCLNDIVIKSQDEPDMLAWELHALSYHGPLGDVAKAMLERVWSQRDELNPYTRALLLLTVHNQGEVEKASILVDNLRNGARFDEETGTVHWGQSGVYYRWSDGGIEATAYALKALLAADPNNPMIDQAMLWLARNRRGARWESTRDTAVVVYALADYIKVRGEAKPEYRATVFVNGERAGSIDVDPDNVFDLKGEIEVPAEMLQSGANEIKIVKQGAGALYASAWLSYYTLEDQITAAGNEIFVMREYYKLIDKPNAAGEITTEREPIAVGTPVQSGDRIEVVLNVDAKNHYEYLVFEDYKAAGLEPVEVQSGYEWKDGLSIYKEYRDERTALFVTRMEQGEHKLTYIVRAEIPGYFSALPAKGCAMYVPEIRANSDEFKFDVKDKPSE